MVWDGEPGCEHEWGDEKRIIQRGNNKDGLAKLSEKCDGKPRNPENWATVRGDMNITNSSQGQFCQLCGAWLGSIGLEPDVDLYVRHIVDIFREVRRVLRPDGVLLCNLGDSYASGKGSCFNPGGGESSLEGHQKLKDNKAYKLNRPNVSDLEGMGLKPKDLIGIPWRVAFALQAAGWYLRSAMPWVKRCLSGGTIVYARTQKGVIPTTIKDIVRLKPETVELWNGHKWTQVKGFAKTIPERGEDQKKRRAARRVGREIEPQKYIELELRSGEKIGCTKDHRWPTNRGVLRTDDLKKGDILQQCILPEPQNPMEPYFLPAKDIGWFVGMFIAEGSTDKKSIKIHGHDKEVDRQKRLKTIAEKYGGTAWVYSIKNTKATTVTITGKVLTSIINTYVSGKGAKGKHLSPAAWQRSNDFLHSVLGGYLEGDGHWDKKANHWKIGFTNNDALAADLRTICARLGHSIRLKRTIHKIKGIDKKYPGWRGRINFRTKTKIYNKTSYKMLSDSEIVKIGVSRARNFYDIEVEDDPHLFSLTSGILTHNSAMPESCMDRPASALEYVFLLTKSQKYYFDMDAIRVAQSENTHARYSKRVEAGLESPPAARKDSKEITGPGFEKFREYTPKTFIGGRNFRNTDLYFESLKEPHGMIFCGDEPVGLDVNPQAFKEAHFATFAEKLIKPLILAGTSERGACPAKIKKLRIKEGLEPEERKKVMDYLQKKGLV